MSEPNLDRGARLIERLIELRDDILDRMLRRGRGGARAVVSDDDQETRLDALCRGGAVAAVALDPVRATALAGRLIEAAGLRPSPRSATASAARRIER